MSAAARAGLLVAGSVMTGATAGLMIALTLLLPACQYLAGR